MLVESWRRLAWSFLYHTTSLALVYDPEMDVLRRLEIGDVISGENKFDGAVVAPDGKVIMIPREAGNIGVYDPFNDDFHLVPVSAPSCESSRMCSDNLFSGGVLLPNGHVLFIPYGSNYIGIFDPSSESYDTLDIYDQLQLAPVANANYKYHGGVAKQNGDIIFIPNSVTGLGQYTPTNKEASYRVSGGVPNGWKSLLSPHFNKR